MTTHAPLDVQLIGYTVYEPPMDQNRDGWLLDPAEDSSMVTYPVYDGSALAEFAGRSCYESYDRPNPETATNAAYLQNIIRQGHGSVLEHASVTFYITGVSRSLTHELIRHRHLSYSELSQRFVDVSKTRAVVPPLIEAVALSLRDQGKLSDDPETGDDYTIEKVLQMAAVTLIEDSADQYSKTAEELTDDAAEVGIPVTRKQVRETSRAFLPNATETKITVTGNYRAWMDVLVKRDSPHADAEIARLAREIGRQLAEHAPNVFGAEARELWNPAADRSVDLVSAK